MTRVDVPTVWTRPLQRFTALASLLTTIGTAIVLGYVNPDVLEVRFPALSPGDMNGFVFVFRLVGGVFLAANAVGLLATWNKKWIFYFILVLDAIQGIGFLTFNRDAAGLRDIGAVGSILTDGGGGLIALILLGFFVRYRTAWAYRRT